MTYRELIYDCFTILKQNFSEKEITLNHIAYWVRSYADRLLSQHLQKHDTEAYLQVFNQLPVLTEQPTGRKYIEIPMSIFDLDGDEGVNFISYDYKVDTNAFTKVRFTRTTMSKAMRLYYTKEETPAPDNPYWYRANKSNLYLLGLECIDVKFVEAGLLITFSNMPCDLDEEIAFPNELVPVLQRQILDLGRFVLQIPDDRTNDGDYDAGKMPNTKIVSSSNQVNNNGD